jgi:hypothetical protein
VAHGADSTGVGDCLGSPCVLLAFLLSESRDTVFERVRGSAEADHVVRETAVADHVVRETAEADHVVRETAEADQGGRETAEADQGDDSRTRYSRRDRGSRAYTTAPESAAWCR